MDHPEGAKKTGDVRLGFDRRVTKCGFTECYPVEATDLLVRA